MPMHPALTAVVVASLAGIALAQREGGQPGQGGPPNPEQFIERMMSNDANGDGKLSADELPGRFAERLFETGDTNKDGFLDRTELTEVAKNIGAGGFGRRGAGGEGGAPGAPAGAIPPGDRRADVPASELNFHDAMQQAGRALRQLRRSAFDASSRANDLEQIQILQTRLIAAKGQIAGVPMAPQAKERYGSDTTKYEADFRLQTIQAIMESLALEAAVVEGDTAGAKESLEHLLAAQKQGHDAFQPEEDEAEDETAPEPTRVRPGAPGAPGAAGRPGRGG